LTAAFDTWWAFCQLPNNDGQGLHNTPGDPGGWTSYGITLRTYQSVHPNATKDDLAKMTQAEAAEIAQSEYWNATKCDKIAGALGIVVCDAAWASGPETAIRWLQKTLDITADGIFGPMTLASCDAILPTGIAGYCTKFTNTRIAANNNPEFNRGWNRRENACLQIALGYIKGN
jgi:lysozyme family protein